MNNPMRGVVFPLLVVPALILAWQWPAVADDWGTETSATGPHPDGSGHSWCWGVEVYGGVNADIFDNVQEAEYVALQSETLALAPYKDSCVYSGSSETDVVWLTHNLPAGVRGQTFCENHSIWTGYCDQAYATLDLNEIAAEGGPTEKNETKSACHELGHTVGLTHHPNGTSWGCMVSGPVTSDVQWRRFVSHHKNHIDGWFINFR